MDFVYALWSVLLLKCVSIYMEPQLNTFSYVLQRFCKLQYVVKLGRGCLYVMVINFCPSTTDQPVWAHPCLHNCLLLIINRDRFIVMKISNVNHHYSITLFFACLSYSSLISIQLLTAELCQILPTDKWFCLQQCWGLLPHTAVTLGSI